VAMSGNWVNWDEADSSPWRAILTFCGAVHLLVNNSHVSAALHEANELVWIVHELRHDHELQATLFPYGAHTF
jgi:hypothetical protein